MGCLQEKLASLPFLSRRLESEPGAAMEFTILAHVLFSTNLESIDTRLLSVRELIEKCYTFLPVLLIDTQSLKL